MSTAIKCPCKHKACTAWMVDPEAAVQGVRFTEEQAKMIARVLNAPELVTEAWKRGYDLGYVDGTRGLSVRDSQKKES